MRTAVVVPTIREDQAIEFLRAWSVVSDVTFVMVQDGGGEPFNLGSGVYHFGWDDINGQLGNDSWIIPRMTDCIRSFGIWWAWTEGYDIIVSLDDDVRPVQGLGPHSFFAEHQNRLQGNVHPLAWQSTIQGSKERGRPYFKTARTWPCVLNHGLWEGVPDLDAVTQLREAHLEDIVLHDMDIWPGRYFAMCGMNVAFRREIAPLMYFGLQGPSYPYDRFGDIWCGVIAKKILDRCQLGVHSGQPTVNHIRASDVWRNLAKEQTGYKINEKVWAAVDSVPLIQNEVLSCWHEMAACFPWGDDYWDRLKRAMSIWGELFE